MRVPFSFELLPPRSDKGWPAMEATIHRLAVWAPDFFSVTYGAGGSDRSSSMDVIRLIHSSTPVPVLAHLTCIGYSIAETSVVVREFLDSGVRRFLALRGDPPIAGGPEGDLRSASELVQLIHRVQDEREQFAHDLVPLNDGRGAASGRKLEVAVAAFPAGHPRNRPGFDDVDALVAKQAAGADLAITQLFFDAQLYVDFVRRARAAGVTIPIIPGILPPTTSKRLARAAELSEQASPPELEAALALADPDEAFRLGVAHAASLVRDVVDAGAPAVHLYTFNQHEPALAVLRESGLIKHGSGSNAYRSTRSTLKENV